jgi:hypothetical protein
LVRKYGVDACSALAFLALDRPASAKSVLASKSEGSWHVHNQVLGDHRLYHRRLVWVDIEVTAQKVRRISHL